MTTREELERDFDAMFEAARTARRLHDRIGETEHGLLLEALERQVATATAQPPEEASLRLTQLASLLGQVEGPRAVDALIDILGCEHVEARGSAGEELEGLAFERFKEVAQGIERALKRLPVGSPALAELPYVIVEVPEPGVTKLLGRFLSHEDPDAVAAAIETIVEIGDGQALRWLTPLVNDERTVELADDGSDETSEVTIGELATEAVEILSSFEDDDAAASKRRG